MGEVAEKAEPTGLEDGSQAVEEQAPVKSREHANGQEEASAAGD